MDSTSLASLHIPVPKLPRRLMSGPLPSIVEFSQNLVSTFKQTDCVSFLTDIYKKKDRLCGLVVRVSGYRYRGLGFDSPRYQIF